MKKLSLLVIGLLVSSFVGAEYYAGAGYGLSWNGGHAWTGGQKTDYETFSGMLSVFGGTVIPTEWLDLRAEGELLHLKADADKGPSRELKTVMANLIGMIPNIDSPFQPYIGLGLGYGRWDHKNTAVKQFIAGVEYNLDQYPVGFALEYKHLSPNETGGSGANRSKINSDTVMLKAKYMF